MLVINSRQQIVEVAAAFDPQFGLFEKIAGKDRLTIFTLTATPVKGLAVDIVKTRGRLGKTPMAVQVDGEHQGDYVKLTIIFDDTLVLNI